LATMISMLQVGKNRPVAGHGSMALTQGTTIGTVDNQIIIGVLKTVHTCMATVDTGMIWIAILIIGMEALCTMYAKNSSLETTYRGF